MNAAFPRPSKWIETLSVFDERLMGSWFLASGLALFLAAAGLSVSPEFSGAHLFASLMALAGGALLRFQWAQTRPKGLLTIWVLFMAAVWHSPMASLSSEHQRFVFSTSIVILSFVFQGHRRFYPLMIAVLLAVGAAGLGSFNLGGDLTKADFSSVLRDDSVRTLYVSLFLAALIYSGRVAVSHAAEFKMSLANTTETLERLRLRVASSSEAVHLARERLWGRTLSERSVDDAIFSIDSTETLFPNLDLSTTSFDQMISALRKVFSEFQSEGRAQGRIAGPIRFVFFAPAAGYDGGAIVAADLEAVSKGVTAFLNLALESLPEVGNRKREGVIRLSVRYGVRTIEIAVEDNGRGLASPNPKVEEDFNAIKELTVKWNGKLDRLARLGVGSRTALELRLVGSVKHRPLVTLPTVTVPSIPADGVPLA